MWRDNSQEFSKTDKKAYTTSSDKESAYANQDKCKE